MVGSGFRVDEVLKILLYRKCTKYNLGRAAITRGFGVQFADHAVLWRGM